MLLDKSRYRRQEVDGPPVDFALSFFPFQTDEKRTERRASKTQFARIKRGLEKERRKNRVTSFPSDGAICPVTLFLFLVWETRNFPISKVFAKTPPSRKCLLSLNTCPVFHRGVCPEQSETRENGDATASSHVPFLVIPIFILPIFFVWRHLGTLGIAGIFI